MTIYYRSELAPGIIYSIKIADGLNFTMTFSQWMDSIKLRNERQMYIHPFSNQDDKGVIKFVCG